MNKIKFKVVKTSNGMTTGLLLKDGKPYAHAHYQHDSLDLLIAFPDLEGFDYNKYEILSAVKEETGEQKVFLAVTNSDSIFQNTVRMAGMTIQPRERIELDIDIHEFYARLDDEAEDSEKEYIEIVNLNGIRLFEVVQTNADDGGTPRYNVSVNTDAIVGLPAAIIEESRIEDLVEFAIDEEAIFDFSDNLRFEL
jgi:hypothetical protein